jgi:hypothetical protein
MHVPGKFAAMMEYSVAILSWGETVSSFDTSKVIAAR